MKRKIVFIGSLIVFFIAFFLVFTGSNLLTKPFIKAIEMPFGTIITWLGLIAFSSTIYFGVKKIYYPKTKVSLVFKKIEVFLIVLSCLWGIIGYYLAGNWAYNFTNKSVFSGSEQAAAIFWNFSYILFISPLLVVLIFKIYTFISRILKKA